MFRVIRDNTQILLRLLILFSVFVIMIFSYIILMNKLLLAYPLLNSVARISIPLHGNIPGLDIFGFLVPLFAAIVISLVRLKNVTSISQSIHALIFRYKWWYVASLSAILISFLIPALSASGHTDYPLAVVVVSYVAFAIRQGTMKDRIVSSFVLGYLIGFTSDLQSQVFFTGYFGGGGWVDGDFMLPIFLCLATAASRLLTKFLEPYTGKRSVELTVQETKGNVGSVFYLV
jgi:hypothetical protein